MADRSSLFERAWTGTVETLVFNHLSFDLQVAVCGEEEEAEHMVRAEHSY